MYRYQDSPDFPKRKNPRMKHYDYSTAGYYFITVCTHEKKCLFWTDGSCNPLGRIAAEGIGLIGQHDPFFQVDQFTVMPNHVHMILVAKNDRSSVSSVVGSYKSYVSKRIHEIRPQLKVWQTSFHDHVIRNRMQYEKIWLYIERNPTQWKQDCFYLGK